MTRKPIWQARWYDWIAYWLIPLLPLGRWRKCDVVILRLLPYAGRWQYRNDYDAPLYPGTE